MQQKKLLKQTGSKIAKSNNISRKMYLKIFFSLETVGTRFLSSWIQNQWKSYNCQMILFLVHNTPIYLLFVDLLIYLYTSVHIVPVQVPFSFIRFLFWLSHFFSFPRFTFLIFPLNYLG
jgi:hypothetical protein